MLASLLGAVLLAQANSIVPIAQPAPAGQAVAVRTDQLPRLDGVLDEPAWSRSPVLGGFTQREPSAGLPASERTEARVIYSGTALYVGIRAWDSHAATITGRLTRRDQRSESDWVGVHIDGYHDRRTAFQFAVNAAGVKLDIYRFNDIEEDLSWDAVWDVAVSRDSLGWTAEFRIPFNQLRFAGSPPVFGFNLHRHINRLRETDFWKPIPAGGNGFVSHYGELAGLDGVRPPRVLELQPYILMGETLRQGEAGNPFDPDRDWSGSVGGDARIGLTPGLTLSAAINPDFGQVEADPAVVNLSADEVFQSERRPFFTEGAGAFRFPMSFSPEGPEQLFYSRRIGRAPQRELEAPGGFVESVASTGIVGAGKITGRLGNRWTVGVLGAVTKEETAGMLDSTGTRSLETIEPRTQYLAGRLTREMRSGRTVLGFFGTAVRRDLAPETSYLRRTALTAALELRHRFLDDRYGLRLWLAGSRVAGTAEAIDSTQRSAVHYFQRPDDRGSDYDSTRTRLDGAAAQLIVGKEAGDWLWSAQVLSRTPGFETNDLGFQFWAGKTWQEFSVTRRWLTPSRRFRSAELRLAEFGFYTFGGQRINAGLNLSSKFTLANQWAGTWTLWRRMGGLEPAELRGGPALREPGNWFFRGALSTDPRRHIQAGLGLMGWKYDGREYGGGSIEPSVRWRPSDNQEFTVGVRFESETLDRHFVESVVLGGRNEIVVGRVHQSTAALTLRANRTFTPNLSLQLYAEPFLSTGQYRGYRRVMEPGSSQESRQFEELDRGRAGIQGDELLMDIDGDGAVDLTTDRPDFTIASLKANLVARWEFRPGSTLFLVWQHQRSEELTRVLGTPDGIGAIGRASGENTLQLKVSYRLATN